MTLPDVTFEGIESAAERIAGHAVLTGFIRHPALDSATGAKVLLKPEILQRVGAFKFRGAFNRISQVDRKRFPGGVVACSSGNHAQGVAHAAQLLGLDSVIVMPSDAPRMKIARTRAFGAEVVLYDREREDREAIAQAIGAERRADFVHPFDDAQVIAGQGTVGLEIASQALAAGEKLDMVVVPCSGGGLASGVALAVHHYFPAAEIVIVEPEGFDDFGRSLASGQRESNGRASGSIADALMAAAPGVLPFAIGQRHFGGAVRVSDSEIAAAMRFAFMELKLVVEPGGAAALAALLAQRVPVAGKVVSVILSGGNVDAATFSRLIGSPGDVGG
ncbi:MAG: threonine/serine dehydratase [Hyphomicrobiaceae bacterium]|nr:threonine/serine dehydratase [Hyphomicrobiaceae bacterium]